MSFGKMPQPWYKATGYFFDNDINPEGISAGGRDRPFFANAFAMQLSERAAAKRCLAPGGQLASPASSVA
jgi:hypothetical protein